MRAASAPRSGDRSRRFVALGVALRLHTRDEVRIGRRACPALRFRLRVPPPPRAVRREEVSAHDPVRSVDELSGGRHPDLAAALRRRALASGADRRRGAASAEAVPAGRRVGSRRARRRGHRPGRRSSENGCTAGPPESRRRLFLAVCPGHILWTQYGHVDQHAAESFCGLLALVLFVASRESPDSPGNALREAAAGLALALAVLTWQGGIYWGAIFALALFVRGALGLAIRAPRGRAHAGTAGRHRRRRHGRLAGMAPAAADLRLLRFFPAAVPRGALRRRGGARLAGPARAEARRARRGAGHARRRRPGRGGDAPLRRRALRGPSQRPGVRRGLDARDRRNRRLRLVPEGLAQGNLRGPAAPGGRTRPRVEAAFGRDLPLPVRRPRLGDPRETRREAGRARGPRDLGSGHALPRPVPAPQRLLRGSALRADARRGGPLRRGAARTPPWSCDEHGQAAARLRRGDRRAHPGSSDAARGSATSFRARTSPARISSTRSTG